MLEVKDINVSVTPILTHITFAKLSVKPPYLTWWILIIFAETESYRNKR